MYHFEDVNVGVVTFEKDLKTLKYPPNAFELFLKILVHVSTFAFLVYWLIMIIIIVKNLKKLIKKNVYLENLKRISEIQEIDNFNYLKSFIN